MIISHKHKFIFLKTRKTAGTSLEIALSKICGPKDIISPISKNDEIARKEYSEISAQNYLVPLNRYCKKELANSFFKLKPLQFYNHMTAKQVKSLIPKHIWDNYYKFTIDRNPFDKIVSLYFWRRGHKKFENIYEFLTNGGLKSFTSYEIYSIDGVVAVDKVYKYENLDFVLNDLGEKLQLKEQLKMPKYKAKSTSREVKDYKDILDKESIDLIKIIFAREIELLNYKY